VLTGNGAQTTIDDVSLPMEPGDLILTSGWSWHGHRNDSSEPSIRLDGVDLPLVPTLAVNFSEPSSGQAQPPQHAGQSGWSAAGVIPLAAEPAQTGPSGMLHCSWARTQEAIDDLAAAGADVAQVAFVRPTDGAPITTTFGCYMSRLAPGASTGDRQETASSVVQIFRGRGQARVRDHAFRWHDGDLLAIPHWAKHELRADPGATEPAYLFTMTDRPNDGSARLLPAPAALIRPEPPRRCALRAICSGGGSGCGAGKTRGQFNPDELEEVNPRRGDVAK